MVSVLIATQLIAQCCSIDRNMLKRLTLTGCVFQNSPMVDDEGYSIRPDDESEEADILSVALIVVIFICLNSLSL